MDSESSILASCTHSTTSPTLLADHVTGSDAPAWLPDELPGNYGFDPLGLSKDPASRQRFQESEVIHCRWAMLGAAGVLGVEALGFGNWYDAPLWVSNEDEVSNSSRLDRQDAAALSSMQVLQQHGERLDAVERADIRLLQNLWLRPEVVWGTTVTVTLDIVSNVLHILYIQVQHQAERDVTCSALPGSAFCNSSDGWHIPSVWVCVCLQAVNGGAPTWFGINVPFDLNTLLAIVSMRDTAAPVSAVQPCRRPRHQATMQQLCQPH